MSAGTWTLVNMNADVRFKLTPFGVETLRKEIARYAPPERLDAFVANRATPQADGYVHMRLWEVSSYFHAGLYNGAAGVCFVDNNIEITPEVA